MRFSTTIAATSVIAVLGLATTELSASAQNLANGPNGAQPDRLSSKTMAGKQPSRMVMKPGNSMHRAMRMHRMTSYRYGHHGLHYAAARPLVVRPAPVVAVAPVVAGPETLVTGPLAFGSSVVALPFRGLGTIFPATGDIATNPLVIIGAPLRAAADLVQAPFRVVGAAFGGTVVSSY